jgi:VWFA-related protein
MRQEQSNLSLYAGRAKCAALLLFLCVPLAAQTGGNDAGSSDLKIKTESRLVLVDAVVTGKKDDPVGDLTAKDFHVFEDGKEQPITAFQTHTGSATGGLDQTQRIVLLFDGRSTDDQKWIEDAAAKFVADNAGPNRLMAVEYHDGTCMTLASQFTSDVGQLRKALREWPSTRRCPARSTGPQQGLDLALEYSQLARDLAKVPGHKVLALFFARSVGLTNLSGTGGPMAGPGGVADPNDRFSSAGIERLAESGNSALTEPKGMQLEFRKANVSVYAVEGQSGARAPGWALLLAERTGGRELSRGNDVLGAFAMLGSEQDHSYTLGYVPADSPEGSCHTLKIAVDRPKVKVRGRDLYCNVPEINLAVAKPAEVALESLAATTPAGGTAAAISLPFFYERGGAARVHVVLEVPAPVFAPSEVSGKLRASMDVLGLAYNADGSVAARFNDTAKYTFDSRPQFDAFARQPLRYEHQMKVAPGNYKFKLVFRTAKDRVGVLEAPLAVDTFDAAHLDVSPIALSHDVRPFTPDEALADAETGTQSLTFGGNRIVLAASDGLSKTGVGEAYFEIYEPPAKAGEPVKLTMHLRLFEEPEDEQRSDSGDVDLSGLAKSGDAAIAVGLRLPVAALPVGAYRAEITVKDSAGGEVSRSVQFRIE